MYKVKLEKNVLHPEGRSTLYKIVKLPFPPYPSVTLVDEHEDHIDLEGSMIYYDIAENEFCVTLPNIVCGSKEEYDHVLEQYKSVGWEAWHW